MPNLQMVDLHSQYLNMQEEIDSAVLNVIRSGAFINGPAVKSFQANLEKYLRVDHVIPCANGTDALQIAMMALDLQPGDEVIVPAFTYVATAEVIALLGLKPVMVDVDPHTFNITAELIAPAITERRHRSGGARSRTNWMGHGATRGCVLCEGRGGHAHCRHAQCCASHAMHRARSHAAFPSHSTTP